MTLTVDVEWTRERAGSGPGDTLNGRYELHKARIGRAVRWVIVDNTTDENLRDDLRRVGHPGGYPTMRSAREDALRVVRGVY